MRITPFVIVGAGLLVVAGLRELPTIETTCFYETLDLNGPLVPLDEILCASAFAIDRITWPVTRFFTAQTGARPMKIKVWVISTCVPDENTPCLPEVFGSLNTAEAQFDALMRAEWEANQPEDEETGEPLPYPGDASKAHETLAKNPRWGQWQITGHEIEIR